MGSLIGSGRFFRRSDLKGIEISVEGPFPSFRGFDPAAESHGRPRRQVQRAYVLFGHDPITDDDERIGLSRLDVAKFVLVDVQLFEELELLGAVARDILVNGLEFWGHIFFDLHPIAFMDVLPKIPHKGFA